MDTAISTALSNNKPTTLFFGSSAKVVTGNDLVTFNATVTLGNRKITGLSNGTADSDAISLS